MEDLVERKIALQTLQLGSFHERERVGGRLRRLSLASSTSETRAQKHTSLVAQQFEERTLFYYILLILHIFDAETRALDAMRCAGSREIVGDGSIYGCNEAERIGREKG